MTMAILSELEQGPATTLELAMITDFPRRSVAARLSELSRQGKVSPWGKKPARDGMRGRPATIWRI